MTDLGDKIRYEIDLSQGDIKDGDTVTIQVAAKIGIDIKNTFGDVFVGAEPPTSVPVGQRCTFELEGGYTLQVTGGYIYVKTYTCNVDEQGDPVVSCSIDMRADGSALTMTLTVVEDKNVPTPAQVIYEDTDVITEETKEQKYVIPGYNLWVNVKDGYLVEADHGRVDYYGTQNGYSEYLVYVDEDATEVTVSTSMLATNAKIHITPTEAVVSGNGFVTDGDPLTNGRGRIKVKNGYDLAYDNESGEDKMTGGVCTFSDYEVAEKGCPEDEIYTIYDILATTGDVTIELDDLGRKDSWVKVTVRGTQGLIDFAINPDYKYSEGEGVYTILAMGGTLSIRQIPGYTVTADAGKLTTDAVGDIYVLELNDGQKAVTLTVSREGTSTCQHTWGPWTTTTAATCGADGVKSHTCTKCGETETEAIPATGAHKWDNGAVTEPPTYLEKGVKTFACTLCGETKTEEIPVLEPTVTATTDVLVLEAEAAKKQMNDTVNAAVDALVAGKTPAGLSDKAVEAIETALQAGGSDPNKVNISTKLTVDLAEEAVEGADATYDIDITVLVNGTEAGEITETGSPISLCLPLPQASKGPIIYVVRVHDGKTEKLTTTVKGETVYFSSDKFSAFAIISDNDIANATVGAIADQTYTGKAITPGVTVTVQGREGTVTLKEGTDYTLSYKSNVEAGTATVVITGKGTYTGTKEATFKIVKPAASGSGSGTGAKAAPATGDETPIALYAGLLALSAGALALTLTRRKKTSR